MIDFVNFVIRSTQYYTFRRVSVNVDVIMPSKTTFLERRSWLQARGRIDRSNAGTSIVRRLGRGY